MSKPSSDNGDSDRRAAAAQDPRRNVSSRDGSSSSSSSSSAAVAHQDQAEQWETKCVIVLSHSPEARRRNGPPTASMRCFMRPVDPRAGLQAAVVTKHSTDLATILADAAAMSATSPANIRIVLEAAADADATSADTPQSHLLQRAQAAGMPQAGIAGRPLVADWMDPVNAYLARIYAPHIAFARSYYDSVRSGAAFGVLAKISDAVFVERRPVDFAFRMADKAVSLAAAVRERMARGSGGEGGDDGGTEKS